VGDRRVLWVVQKVKRDVCGTDGDGRTFKMADACWVEWLAWIGVSAS